MDYTTTPTAAPRIERLRQRRGSAIQRIALAPPVRRVFGGSSSIARAARPLVAGERPGDAVALAHVLHAHGILSTVHIRQAPVADAHDADAHVDAYRTLAVALGLGNQRLRADMSVKMEQLGFRVDGWERAVDRLAVIARCARDSGVTVTLDMEGPEEVDATLDAAEAVREAGAPVGVAVQARLRRTLADCERLARDPVRVRLVKGGYQVPQEQTVGGRTDVDLSFVRCLRTLMEGASYPMVATHDPRLVAAARCIAPRAGRKPEEFEYQFLQGIAVDQQRQLVSEGAVVRAYVACGPEWYSWLAWLVSEKPSNLRLLAHRGGRLSGLTA